VDQLIYDFSYHQHSKADDAMYRFKLLTGPKLGLRDYSLLVDEILGGVKVMNKIIRLGMPVQQLIN